VKPIPTLEVTNASVCNGTAATITATGNSNWWNLFMEYQQLLL
jgi:hypothetical protein